MTFKKFMGTRYRVFFLYKFVPFDDSRQIINFSRNETVKLIITKQFSYQLLLFDCRVAIVSWPDVSSYVNKSGAHFSNLHENPC